MDDFILSQLKSFFFPKSMLLPWKALRVLIFSRFFGLPSSLHVFKNFLSCMVIKIRLRLV